MLRTRLCELLDIEVPILAAPMGPEITSLRLAAAVSSAGGLGIISFGGYPPPGLRERIRKLRALTSRPFGVNVLLEGPHLRFPKLPLWTSASRSASLCSRSSGATPDLSSKGPTRRASKFAIK